LVLVDQRHPAIALAGRDAGKLQCGGADQQTGRKYRQTLHERGPPMAAFGWAQPITATRGVNPFFMLQLRCATFALLPPITHALRALLRGKRPASIAATR
jgi:hypothetical protein